MIVEELLRALARRQPKLVALARRRIRREELLWVLQSLKDEGIATPRLDVILETLLDQPAHPLASVRAALAPQVVQPYLASNQTLHSIGIVQLLDEQIARGRTDEFLRLLRLELDAPRSGSGRRLVLLCDPRNRFRIRRLLRSTCLELPVIAWDEVPPGLGVNMVALLRCAADLRAQQRLEERLARGGEPYRKRLLKRLGMGG